MRNGRLRHSDETGQITDAQLPLCQRRDKLQARRVAQRPEGLRKPHERVGRRLAGPDPFDLPLVNACDPVGGRAG